MTFPENDNFGSDDVMPGFTERGTFILRQDCTKMAAIGAKLLSGSIESVYTPEENVFISNHVKDPFDYFYMNGQAMNELGYEVHFYDNAKDSRGFEIEDSVAEYVDPVDAAAVRRMAFTNAPDIPHNTFLQRVTSVGMHAWYIQGPHAEQVADKLLPQLDTKEATRALARGFVTSRILRQIQAEKKEYDHVHLPEDGLLYEALRDQGVKPFNVEELYGMASSIVKTVISSDPNIAPPSSKRRVI